MYEALKIWNRFCCSIIIKAIDKREKRECKYKYVHSMGIRIVRDAESWGGDMSEACLL